MLSEMMGQDDKMGMKDDSMGGMSDTSGMMQDAIMQVRQYMKDPGMVTPQTLKDLLGKLQMIQSSMDDEEMGEGDESSGGEPSSPDHKGLAIMIGMPKSK